MAILVVQAAVEEYGSTHDKDIVIPWTMVTENHPPRGASKKTTTTTWMLACLLGLTTATVLLSNAVLFVSRRESSSVLQASTEEAFLLHRKDGTCVVQSGVWPPGTTTAVDGDRPFATCYEFLGDDLANNDLCWSRSFYSKHGNWNPCLPNGYGSGGWTAAYGRINDCGPPCTEFDNFDENLKN